MDRQKPACIASQGRSQRILTLGHEGSTTTALSHRLPGIDQVPTDRRRWPGQHTHHCVGRIQRRGGPLSSRADGGQPPCPQQRPIARTPQPQTSSLPPRGSRRSTARREAWDPVPPPGDAGTKAAHAPGTLENHAGAGTMTPATRGTGATRQNSADERGSTGFIADPGPPRRRGRRGKPLGRRDPRDPRPRPPRDGQRSGVTLSKSQGRRVAIDGVTKC